MNRRKFLITSGTGILGLTALSGGVFKITNFITKKENMKRILVITGSPRKNGNSDLLADAFIKGAKQAGHETVKFETAFKNLNKCHACYNCFKIDNHACIFNDDFNELAKEISLADIIVFSTPLYWTSFPSNLKAAIDKLYSFHTGQKLQYLKGKKAILLAVAGDDKKEGFDILIKSYQVIVSFNEWKEIGKLIVPGVIEKGDILKTNALAEAELMGKSL